MDSKKYLDWVVIPELHFSICLGKALERGKPEIVHRGGIYAWLRLSVFPAHPIPLVESVSHIPHFQPASKSNLKLVLFMKGSL